MTAVSAEAFSREAAELRPLLRAVAASVLHVAPGHPDVDDAVSETMRRALEGRARLRPGEPVRGWIVGIVKHVALDAARSRTRALKRQAPEPAAESVRDVTDRIPDSKPSPFDRTARMQELAKLDAAMAALPEKQREAVTLFFLEGLSYVEIGEKLGVPVGTVATWILRGKKALAATLSERNEQ
ncbi:MAG TPA: sigma-70 family RNA polymerase sigma factor [Polyangiaceae bacterium]